MTVPIDATRDGSGPSPRLESADTATPTYGFFPSDVKIKRAKYPTSIDSRGYIPVAQYTLKGHPIMLDTETRMVLFTSIYRALGKNKADIVRLLECEPGLAPYLRKLKGGCLKLQGTWVPFDIARELARRVAWPIRHDLVPLFGPSFPDSCVAPDQPGYGSLRWIDPAPDESTADGSTLATTTSRMRDPEARERAQQLAKKAQNNRQVETVAGAADTVSRRVVVPRDGESAAQEAAVPVASPSQFTQPDTSHPLRSPWTRLKRSTIETKEQVTSSTTSADSSAQSDEPSTDDEPVKPTRKRRVRNRNTGGPKTSLTVHEPRRQPMKEVRFEALGDRDVDPACSESDPDVTNVDEGGARHVTVGKPGQTAVRPSSRRNWYDGGKPRLVSVGKARYSPYARDGVVGTARTGPTAVPRFDSWDPEFGCYPLTCLTCPNPSPSPSLIVSRYQESFVRCET